MYIITLNTGEKITMKRSVCYGITVNGMPYLEFSNLTAFLEWLDPIIGEQD